MAVTPEAPSRMRLQQIELLIGQGDDAFRRSKYVEALQRYKEARARIYGILYPGFDVISHALAAHDRILPTSVEIERSLIGASVAMFGVVRPEQVDRQPPLAHVTDVPIDRELAIFTRTGYRERVSADARIQEASSNGIALLRENKPDQAFSVMQQALATVEADGAAVDPALLGALELNLGSVALQLRDAERAKVHSENALRRFTQSKDTVGRAQALHVSAIATRRLGDNDGAGQLFDRAATELAEAGPPASLPVAATLAGGQASRDPVVLGSIAQRNGSIATLRIPGRTDGWSALVLDDDLQLQQVGKPWTVGVQLGEDLTRFEVGGFADPSADEFVARIYQARVTKERFADLHIKLDGPSSTTAHLTHLYAYALLVKLGDAYHVQGLFQQAEDHYLQAAGYSFLNQALEGPVLWTRLARNAVGWGHARYKGGDLPGAADQYSKLITTAGTVPASFLYDTAALTTPADDARTLIVNLLTRPLPTINWDIGWAVLTAHQFLQQIADGLDFYGLALSPIHTFEYLQSIARGFAQEAVQAEREFVNFTSRQEGEEATRRDLESASAMADAEVQARQEALASAHEDESAARNALTLAVTRRNQAQTQHDAYAASSSTQIWAQAAAAALGGGEDALYAEISELADRLDRGETIQGPGPKLAAAQILRAGRRSRAYELKKMEDTIVELARAITIAQDQVDSAVRRTAAAEIAVEAAKQRAEMTKASLEAFDDEFFTPESWQRMADVVRDISRSYLFRAIRIAQLMERAYNFENDTTLKIIKDDYGHGVASPEPGRDVRLLGGDSLLDDIDAFTYHAVTTKTRKASRIKDVISVSEDFPAQFEKFRRTGLLSFETDLYEFDRLHPGFYGQRIEEVEVQVVGILPEGGLNGTLSLGGVTRFRRKDGTAAERVHEVDTMALSEFVVRNDGFLYRAETGVRGLFQGFGVGCTWVMHLPKRSNAVDFRRIFDVQIAVYYTARFDNVLRTSVLTTDPRPDELVRVRTYGLRYDFPDAWFAFYQAGAMQFTLDRFSLPPNQKDFAVQTVSFRLVPAAGFSAEGIELRISGPDGAGGVVTTDADGVVSTEGADLAGLVGIDPLGDWTVDVLGGAAITDNGVLRPERIYNLQVGLEYRFAYVVEEVV
ncbi:hypothetical protein [uncultured Pseudonocardia sp.]|uniref:Tc toxin subunit A-related protein n=1 Tax=uncultured Pseudonocardia sp. TaxID=211455 RepID=UPI00260E896D|nr:hypothetical protein [uncultured Pseudonocardia sp.]